MHSEKNTRSAEDAAPIPCGKSHRTQTAAHSPAPNSEAYRRGAARFFRSTNAPTNGCNPNARRS